MRVDTKVVTDLDGYFKAIRSIAEDRNNKGSNCKRADHPRVLWFRGLSDINHSLIPSLFRKDTRVERVKGFNTDYSSLHYAEDIFTQHYIAKNFHFFRNEPSSRVEWLEVMQHHGVYTRVLDWSESSVHSLLFSVEMFLDDDRHKGQQRDEAVPCVWVLDPAALNRKIFNYLKENLPGQEIESLLDEMSYNLKDKKKVLSNIEKFSQFDIYGETAATEHMDYILNLSAINDEILRDRERMRQLLLDGAIINPYYYLLSRIYSDGHILNNRTLPPLAVVQPYHSERIKAQRGVFTVFPFYSEQEGDKVCREIGINPDAMDNNNAARACLHQIVIGDPRTVAYELLQNGMNISWLYPEMPVVSNEIVNHKVY